MKKVTPSLLLILLAGTSAPGLLQAAPALMLLPSAGISGPPGSTIGWGFTITNDANYIEITSAQFCVDPVDFPLVCNPPTTGTFTDYISQFNDIIVGPPGGTVSDVVTQPFDATALTGVGALDISPTAPVGASDVGRIVLTYNEFDANPNGPSNVIANDLVLSAAAAATVVAPGTAPEPGTVALAGVALLCLALSGRRRRRP